MADAIGATVIESDDFYAGGSGESWDAMSAADKAAYVIDWRAQRPVLDALHRGEPVSYHPYDWDDEANDGWAPHVVTVVPAPVVILDGAYSARPELADLLDLRVLLLIDDDVRRAQLLAREGDRYRSDWEARWTEAELHYFGTVMPPTPSTSSSPDPPTSVHRNARMPSVFVHRRRSRQDEVDVAELVPAVAARRARLRSWPRAAGGRRRPRAGAGGWPRARASR